MPTLDYDPDDLFKVTDSDEITDWLEAVTEAIDDGRLEPSSWEVDFLDSIADRLEEKAEEEKPLTGKQLVSLCKIYDKAED